MNVTLVSYTPGADEVCGMAAAICTGYEGEPIKALRGAMASGHESVAEHNAFTFRIEGVSRVLLAQLTRHRLASFSVQSQRYCGVDSNTVIPDNLCRPELVDDIIAVKQAEKRLYAKAAKLGVPDEDIRYYTVQAHETQLILTMNARELRHFFALRCCNRSQWEIRLLADKMLALCKGVAPVLFEGAGCACMAGKPCPEKRGCGKPRGGVNGENA